jgi:hypothetical protein
VASGRGNHIVRGDTRHHGGTKEEEEEEESPVYDRS